MSFTPIKATTAGGGKDFEPVPEGSHFAICIRVVYLGIQDVTFEGQTKQQPKVWFQFEVPDVQVEYEKGGKKVKGPATIGREFTLNIGDKSNLGPFIANWRAKQFTAEEAEGFDVSSLLGKVCNLGVVHKKKGDKTYANISSAGKILKIQQDAIQNGTLSVKPHNELLSFNADAPDPEVYEKLPNFLKKKIDARVLPKPAGAKQSGGQLPAGYERIPGGDDDLDAGPNW